MSTPVHAVIVILTVAHRHFGTLQKGSFQCVAKGLQAMPTSYGYVPQTKHFTKYRTLFTPYPIWGLLIKVLYTTKCNLC